MAVLRKRFEKGTGEGINVPATLLFFGRDELQSTVPDSAAPPNAEDSQKREMDPEEELRQKRRQAQEEDERSASDIEVRLSKLRTVLFRVTYALLFVYLRCSFLVTFLAGRFLGSCDAKHRCQLRGKQLPTFCCDASW